MAYSVGAVIAATLYGKAFYAMSGCLSSACLKSLIPYYNIDRQIAGRHSVRLDSMPQQLRDALSGNFQ